jgi:hypothetical protein
MSKHTKYSIDCHSRNWKSNAMTHGGGFPCPWNDDSFEKWRKIPEVQVPFSQKSSNIWSVHSLSSLPWDGSASESWYRFNPDPFTLRFPSHTV